MACRNSRCDFRPTKSTNKEARVSKGKSATSQKGRSETATRVAERSRIASPRPAPRCVVERRVNGNVRIYGTGGKVKSPPPPSVNAAGTDIGSYTFNKEIPPSISAEGRYQEPTPPRAASSASPAHRRAGRIAAAGGGGGWMRERHTCLEGGNYAASAASPHYPASATSGLLLRLLLLLRLAAQP